MTTGLKPMARPVIASPAGTLRSVTMTWFWLLTAMAGASLTAWVFAQAGMKGAVAGVAGLSFLAALLLVSQREDLVLAIAVLSMSALFHKAFGELAAISSGPPAIYLSSFDVMVGLLWLTWFVRSPQVMAAELRDLFRHRSALMPLIAMVLLLPGVLSAGRPTLAVAEFVRMIAMYALFLYLGARVRSRRQVWIVLGALAFIAVAEAVVVAGQWKTRSALGLSLFGTPSVLENRFDGIAVARPFGTMAHPVFMAAFMGALGLVALSLAINLPRTWHRLAALAVAAMAVSPILLANARSAALGVAVAFFVLTITSFLVGRLSGRVVAGGVVVAVFLVMAGWPLLNKMWSNSVSNDHFSLEVRSRVELNHVAVRMFEDKPFFGHGLNNFEQVMPRYDRYGLIYADNPVHNVYLLYLSEAGIAGALAIAILGASFLTTAVRLSRSPDRLLSGIGFGAGAAYLFWAVEEMLVFSLRQDHPRALLFVLGGLSLGAGRLAGSETAVIGARQLRPAEFRRLTRVRPRPGLAVARLLVRGVTACSALVGVMIASGSRPGLATHIGRIGRIGMLRVNRIQPPGGYRRVLLVVLLAVPFVLPMPSDSTADWAPNLDGARIVFSATDRSTGSRGIYLLEPGDGVARHLDIGGLELANWPTWSADGSRLLFTARPANWSQQLGAPEAIFSIRPDGSDRQQLTANPWRNAHPRYAADGRSITFTSLWEEYPKVAIFRLDLISGQVSPLSAMTRPNGAFDSDPSVAPDGSLYLIDALDPVTGTVGRGQLATLSADGSTRVSLGNRAGYDTDPAVSPDGRRVALARYVGQGTPQDPTAADALQVKLRDFRLVVREGADGSERELTAGGDCASRLVTPCDPSEGAAWVPRFSPDGSGIGFVSVLSATTTCICAVPPEGGTGTIVHAETNLAIDWFDWVQPNPAAPTPLPAPSAAADRLLFSAASSGGAVTVQQSGPDRWGSSPIAIDPALEPDEMRWSADHRFVIFSGKAPVVDPVVYGPAPPAGQNRQRHYVLNLTPMVVASAGGDATSVDATRQLFLFEMATGRVRQLTTPGTEDWRDAIPDGDLHANSHPDLSSDGRYALFTSRSASTGEAAILRLDLFSGEVLSLTNATAGAVAVTDSTPRFSPDGSTVAFSSRSGEGSAIWVMDTEGYGARVLVDDGKVNLAPTWSPDGRMLAYTSYGGDDLAGTAETAGGNVRAAFDATHWALMTVDVATATTQARTTGDGNLVLSPAWSPRGDAIAYISLSPSGQTDVWNLSLGSGVVAARQITLRTTELGLDWR